MKKLLMGTLVLTLFAISFSLVQISCSKTNAQTSSVNLVQLNKVAYARSISGSDVQIWTVNYDGSNDTQIPVVLPATVHISNDQTSFGIKLSPDGQKLFFIGYDTSTTPYSTSIYSCNIDGSNVQAITSSSTVILKLGGAY